MGDDTLVGQNLAGFRIVRRIGAGAMGVVYEAVDLALMRTVALKVLPDAVTRDPARRARFLREARAAAAVTHPAVATIHQVGQDHDRVFITMELVAGRTLRERLVDGPMAPSEAVGIAVEIASGLARAHAAGVVHRDIKPDNIIVTPEGRVKILDFGIARVLDEAALPSGHATGEGNIVGSPGYMAPEQARGATLDGRADIFALGVVLYELLSGQRPFAGATPMDLVIATMRDAHRSLAGTHVPDALAAVVDRCLAKEPAERIASATTLIDALQAIALAPTREDPAALAMSTLGPGLPTPAITGSPRADPPSSAPPVAIGRARRVPWILGVGLIGAVVIAVLIASRADVARAPMAAQALAGLGSAGEVRPALRPAAALGVLAAPDSVLACPVLEAVGTEEPSGWLGAAAAHALCERATILLGGRFQRTRVPAELLDLPRTPVDDFPDDPYCQPEARDASRAAARRADAWLDGRIALTRDGFALDLTFEAPGRLPLAVHGEGKALVQAVAAATDALVDRGALPRIAHIDEGIARWTGVHDVDLALYELDAYWSLHQGVDFSIPLARLSAAHRQLGLRWPLFQRFVASLDGTYPKPTALPTDLPPEDTSLPEVQARRLTAQSLFVSSVDERKRIADQLALLRAEVIDCEGDSYGPIMLTVDEATVRYSAGDFDGARRLVLWLADRAPREVDWSLVGTSALRGVPLPAAMRAMQAWYPAYADGWHGLALSIMPGSGDRKLRLHRRAYLLSPTMPLFVLGYAFELLFTQQPLRARALAVELMDGQKPQRDTAETILAMIDASEGRFDAAYTRARAAFLGLERFGNVGRCDGVVTIVGFGTAIALGREHVLADELAQRFVLGDADRIEPGHFGPKLVTDVCAFASKPVAERCFTRLHQLIDAGYFTEGLLTATEPYVLAGEAFARGDFKAAASAWRPLLGANMSSFFAPMIYDRAGEPDIASGIDKASVAVGGPLFHGATLGAVREARRAFARADWERARELAERVVVSWETADVKVAAVDEMKALLTRLPRAAKPDGEPR